MENGGKSFGRLIFIPLFGSKGIAWGKVPSVLGGKPCMGAPNGRIILGPLNIIGGDGPGGTPFGIKGAGPLMNCG